MIYIFLRKHISATLLLLSFYGCHSKTADKDILSVSPPYFGFYTKVLDLNGIPIRSSSQVDDQALVVAYNRINRMMANIPEVRYNLAQWGAEFHIIGRDQSTSDLPEYRNEKGKTYIDNTGVTTNIDDRTRGKGGIYASCGEENLLKLKPDRYAGSDICIHEFAHTIMDFGLDEQLEDLIKQQFLESRNLWQGAYAATDQGEYWAELSMWYFGSHGEFLKNSTLPAPGPDGLKRFDPKGYELLKKIYSGRLKSKLMKVFPASRAPGVPYSAWDTTAAYLMIVNNLPDSLRVNSYEKNGNDPAFPGIPLYSRVVEPSFIKQTWRLTNVTTGISDTWRVDNKYSIVKP